jgi:hypothetical protein
VENSDNSYLALLDALVLFLKWKKKVFGEFPVEKGSRTRVYRYDFERSDFTYLTGWFLSGSNETVFRVAGKENLEFVARFGAFRNFFGWQKNFAQITTVKEKSVIGFVEGNKLIDSPELRHFPR